MSRTVSPSASVTALNAATVALRHFLVALDASGNANHALAESARLAAAAGGTVTGLHVYAARLHDRRFRQMEGGLPEQFRKESELERQREVHDSLITRGLSIISDSYHAAAAPICEKAGVPYRGLSLEGKNYRCIVEAAEGGGFDVLVLGALGLGSVPASVIGTVCERVARRSPIDTLIVREPGRMLGDGPLVVGLDGSAHSFGALKTAFELGRRLGAPVHAVAAYDPFFHYVAFGQISGTLTEAAAREFRFKEQEKLHEEVIDSGLAKIYRSHLELARSIAADEGCEIVCELLEGKPYQAILGYLRKTNASLLLLGKTGIHADPGLDIGGNAENLLRLAPCHVWLGQRLYTPPSEALARETISWTEEAEAAMARVPQAARRMVRAAILRLAQESGHTVITSALIDEATQRFCPHRGNGTTEEIELPWSGDAVALLNGLGDAAKRENVRLRVEKQARRLQAKTILPEHVHPFLGESAIVTMTWQAAALARLMRAPAAMRPMTRARIEAYARRRGISVVTAEIVEEKYSEWLAGSNKQAMTLSWDAEAEARIGRVPEFVRGMVILEVERCARAMGRAGVTGEIMGRAIESWHTSGSFHSGIEGDLYTPE